MYLLPVPLLDSGDLKMNKKTLGSALTGLRVKWIDVHHDDEQELGMLLGKCDRNL